MFGDIRLGQKFMADVLITDSAAKNGGAHLDMQAVRGIKAEPIVSLQSGEIVGYELLSLLSTGICSEIFFEQQSATALTELFLLQLKLSRKLSLTRCFINLPVRVLIRDSLCSVLCGETLRDVVVEIQDVDQLEVINGAEHQCFRRNLERLIACGAEVYADDVRPDSIVNLQSLSLPLSGVKISRHDFRAYLYECPACLPLAGYEKLAPLTVVEGVETNEQHLIAATSGVSYGQGYLWTALSGYFN